MMTREVFKGFMEKLINRWVERDKMFDSVEGFINFEPFYETDFYHIAVEGISIAVNANNPEAVAEDIEYWLTYYFEGHPEDTYINCGKKDYHVTTIDELYDYLAEVYMH